MAHRRTDPALFGPFLVEFAADPAARVDEFRLRYSIYVTERRYLVGDPATQTEQDEFDDRSVAFLLRDAHTGEAAACQRFILPDRLAPGELAPIEEFTDNSNPAVVSLPRSSWAEVSRTAIAKPYRGAVSGVSAMRVFKYASLAVTTAMDRSTLFSISDERTAPMTRRYMGFPLEQIGAAHDHHGLRAPYRMRMQAVRDSIAADRWASMQTLIAHACEAIAA